MARYRQRTASFSSGADFGAGNSGVSNWQACAKVGQMVVQRLFVTADDRSGALAPPGRGPATAVRRLREGHLISGGIEVRTHRGGRLRGTAVYYCALNL